MKSWLGTSAAERGHFPGPLAAFAIAFGAWFATAALIVLMRDPADPKIGIALIGIGQAVGLGAVGTLAARSVPEPRPLRLGLQGFAPRWVLPLLLLVPISLVVSELVNVAELLFPPPDAPEVARRIVERVDTTTPISTLETAIVLVGISPVVEEWLYRGVLQQGLVAHLGRARGVLVTAALFGLAHAEPTLSAASTLAIFVATLPLGVILGAVRLATGSLLAPMLVHAAYNGLALVMLACADAIPIAGYNAPGAHTPLVYLIPAVVAVTLGMVSVVRDAKLSPLALPIPEPPRAEDHE